MNCHFRNLLISASLAIPAALPVTAANATPIRFMSGSATYYTETATVDFQFTFDRPLSVDTGDYFTFGGTIVAPQQNAGEFFIVSTDATLPPLTALIEFRPVTPNAVTQEMGYFQYQLTDDQPPFTFQLTVPFTVLGISSSVFQVAGDVCGPAINDQFDSFGVDSPVFSQINVPQVTLAEPTSTIAQLFAAIFSFLGASMLTRPKTMV